MKTIAKYILFVFAVCFAINANAQFDPDKICRIDDGQLIFTINLKWTEKERTLQSFRSRQCFNQPDFYR